ncbi:hypothetical protein [Burkholderia sp. AU15512]|uniref:hypothetical protein n=1 Tax=Burkholderia sp. AU15512 TaxID=2015345 RepID=UPI0015C61C7C|nr:hypothetical protein [Burkholderia sp. AU15512]
MTATRSPIPRRMAAVCTGPIARLLEAGLVPLSVRSDARPAQHAESALIRSIGRIKRKIRRIFQNRQSYRLIYGNHIYKRIGHSHMNRALPCRACRIAVQMATRVPHIVTAFFVISKNSIASF